jgi:hypothetical protein
MSRRIVPSPPRQNQPATTPDRAPAQRPHPGLAALARLIARMAAADATLPLGDVVKPRPPEISDDDK